MATGCEINVRFFPPPPDFEGCFTSFYRMDMQVPRGGRIVDHLQPEWANLRFFSGDAPTALVPGGEEVSGARFTATGPSSLPTRFELGTTRVWGIGLFPIGWARFMRAEAALCANALADGEKHPAFRHFAPLAAGLFEQAPDDEAEYGRIIAFFRSLDRRRPDEERIRSVHRAIVDPEVHNVQEMAEATGLALRTLERLGRRYFGFSPKLLLRRQRFMRSLADFMLAEKRNWSAVIDPTYHDQAHFVREFHAFMTMTPSEYAALDHPILGAFMAERSRIWGSPAQTLDAP